MSEQQLASKKGEIEFRRKLVSQQIGGETVLDDEFDAEGIEKILLSRMRVTLERMSSLRNRGVPLSPYLEIGAERCQRSLVMENDIGAHGAAADISFDMLRSCRHYQKAFDKPMAPLRICCDIERLPFFSGALPFVFCYQTLHHFPDPSRAVREVHRVLAPGGRFYFDEEPYRKIAHLSLYRRKVYARETLASSRLRRRLDFLFAREVNNETDHGIVENDTIDVSAWKRALAVFAEKHVTITTVRGISADVFRPRSRLRYLFAFLLGGTISGLCRKGGEAGGSPANLYEALVCPSCLPEGREHALAAHEGGFACVACRKRYPAVDGVAFLLSYPTFRDLYPMVFATVSG